jgi:hypothetical protein
MMLEMVESIKHITFIVKDVQRSGDLLRFLSNLHFYASEGGTEYSPGCKPGELNPPNPQAPKERHRCVQSHKYFGS